MNSTPPMARLMTSCVLGAVCPTYWPTRSSRVTLTRWPFRMNPSLYRISPIRMAIVVLPAPGLPVKHMCNVGGSDSSPMVRRRRSTTNRAAISRIRAFTSRSATSSRSSRLRTSSMRASRIKSRGSTRVLSEMSGNAPRSGGGPSRSGRPGPSGGIATGEPAAAVMKPTGLPVRGMRLTLITLAGRLVRGIGMKRVANDAIFRLLPFQPKARLVSGPVDDELQAGRLLRELGVVQGHPDIEVGERFATPLHLIESRRCILDVEHRHAPHLPVDVPRMRVVGELHRRSPAMVDPVLDLDLDLLVGQVRKVRERTLRDPKARPHHFVAPRYVQITAVDISTTSGTSVDSYSKETSPHTSRAPP